LLGAVADKAACKGAELLLLLLLLLLLQLPCHGLLMLLLLLLLKRPTCILRHIAYKDRAVHTYLWQVAVEDCAAAAAAAATAAAAAAAAAGHILKQT
jgi:hypothetical protein